MIADLGLGSNLGDRLAHLQSGVDGLSAAGCTIVAVSGVYETAPVGGPQQGAYLNAVVRVGTDRDPWALLALAQDLEAAAGRVRGERWGPRTLDVDLLTFGDEVLDEPDLVVPHPRWRERGFVLAPLADLGHPEVREVEWTGVRVSDLELRVP